MGCWYTWEHTCLARRSTGFDSPTVHQMRSYWILPTCDNDKINNTSTNLEGRLRREVIRLPYKESDDGSSPSPSTKF